MVLSIVNGLYVYYVIKDGTGENELGISYKNGNPGNMKKSKENEALSFHENLLWRINQGPKELYKVSLRAVTPIVLH